MINRFCAFCAASCPCPIPFSLLPSPSLSHLTLLPFPVKSVSSSFHRHPCPLSLSPAIPCHPCPLSHSLHPPSHLTLPPSPVPSFSPSFPRHPCPLSHSLRPLSSLSHHTSPRVGLTNKSELGHGLEDVFARRGYVVADCVVVGQAEKVEGIVQEPGITIRL